MTVAHHYPVIVVVGTRPEAIKLVPIILALRASTMFEPWVVSTGQHHEMVRDVFSRADIVPDVELWRERDGEARSLNQLVSSLLTRFEHVCLAEFGERGTPDVERERVRAGWSPAGVIVHGDTSSAFAAALAAFHMQIPVLHVEAGLRAGTSNRSPFPEELNRRLISEIAAMHFAPTIGAAENLIREGVSHGQVFVTGNTGVDAITWASQLSEPIDDPRLEALLASGGRFVLVTAHRRENWHGGLGRIGRAIARIARANPDVQVVAPLHPNPLVRAELGGELAGIDNVIVLPAQSYWTFARLLDAAHVVVTDSGGIQEEAPSVGTPVLVVRDSTERLEGIEAGCVRLVGTQEDAIVESTQQLLSDPLAHARMVTSTNPYGDGFAAERIVAALANLADPEHEPPAPFGPGYDRLGVLHAAGFELSLEVTPLDELVEGVAPTTSDVTPAVGIGRIEVERPPVDPGAP